jgi:hypothetical protein
MAECELENVKYGDHADWYKVMAAECRYCKQKYRYSYLPGMAAGTRQNSMEATLWA